MIVTIRDDLKNLAPLTRKTKPGRLERMLQPLTKFGLFERGNTPLRITFLPLRVNR